MKKLLLLIGIVVLIIMDIQAQYVYIENGEFKLDGQNYYPMILNYEVQIRKNSQNEYWVTPHHCYGNSNEFECHNKTDCLNELKAQFQMVKDMGFNAIRLCGISPKYNSDYNTNISGKIYMNSSLLDVGTSVNHSQTVQEELTPSVRTKMFSFISDILNVAADRGIKVLLLCGGPDTAIYRDKYADYLEALANNFRNNTTLLGYDLFNEPTYFSKMKNEGLDKTLICEIVNNWISRMKAVDPNHLITVGFATSKTVFDWDPEMISVDFASFHPYGTSNQVGNEIYWYAKNMTKPWIIGETGLSADNILVTYEEQRQFASTVLKRCIDCGGDGFSWWQYQDVWWTNPASNYYGLLSHDGITNTSFGGLSVQGTPKPAVNEFKNFPTYIPTYSCPMYSNYYNSENLLGNAIFGKITDNNNNPVSGAVIKGQHVECIGGSCLYTGDVYTITKHDGTFILFSGSISINQLQYSYLKMSRESYFLSPIDNSNPTNLKNVTIAIQQSNTYNSQNSVITNNFIVKGNGSNGGSVSINAPLYIKFDNGTKVEMGGRLNASSNRVLKSSLKLTPLSNCSPITKTSEINEDSIVLSVSQENADNFMVYPNPSNGVLNIQSNYMGYKSIKLYDTYGKTVLSTTTFEDVITLDISSFSSGIYMLKVTTSKGAESRKIIRQ